MIRSSIVVTFAASLLLWSGQVSSSEPQAANTSSAVEKAFPATETCPLHGQMCPVHGQNCPKAGHRHGDGRLCPIAGHRHAAGQPCPLGQGLGQRLGRGEGFGAFGLRPQAYPMGMQEMPMGSSPKGGFFGTLGMPRQYQTEQFPMGYPQSYPVQGYPMVAPSGQYPNEHAHGHNAQGHTGSPATDQTGQVAITQTHIPAVHPTPDQQGQGQVAAGYPQGYAVHPVPDQSGQYPAGYLQGYGYPQGYYPQGSGYPQRYPNYVAPQTERIVYVPYASPPPITVERLAKALPIPRPQIVRRILGDATIYEYPEMPLQLYTTRGPRDFMAPNPPSIGE